MNLSEQEFERIVAEVIRRLRLLDAANGGPIAGGEVSLAERVVTLRSLEGKLANTKRLVVSARAVVTPAAKDELKKYHIELIRR
ncbi:MAG: hypothetical protein SFU86_12490 [Pirellulaceae bacterium]|nr:hypothetical protein [Pirellulaceae bacterium]